MRFGEKLKNCSDFQSIFELVKTAVEAALNRKRAGLILGLSDLPINIGAFYQVGSNFIVMNKILLNHVLETNNLELINSYIFHVLLHEYLHSLGYINEQETQIMSYIISKEFLGENHPATLISRHGIGRVFSEIRQLEYKSPEKMGNIEIIDKFDEENLNYFG